MRPNPTDKGISVNITTTWSSTSGNDCAVSGNYCNVTVALRAPDNSYHYVWSGCIESDTAFMSFVPSIVGTYTVEGNLTNIMVYQVACLATSFQFLYNSYPTLTVNALPTISSYTVTPPVLDVGQPTSLASSVSGGTPPFTYAYTGLPAGCISQNVSTLGCTPSATGSFKIGLSVTDMVGGKAWGNVTLVVNPLPQAKALAAPGTTDVAHGVQFNGTVSGGTPPFTFQWRFGDGTPTVNARNPVHPFSSVGTYDVTLWTNDSTGAPSDISLTILVNSDPSLTGYSASPSTTDVGIATTITASVTGGTLPYTFLYSGLPAGCTTSNTSSLSCMPTGTGTFKVEVGATDMARVTVWGNTTVNVEPPVTAVASVAPPSADVGIAFAFNGSVSGGTPGYTFLWRFGDGVSSMLRNPTHVYSSAGTFLVRFWANDSVGGISLSNVSTTVNARPSVNSFAPSPRVIDLKQYSIFTVTMSGGTFPFSYDYPSLPAGCSTSDTAKLNCTPQVTGTFRITVKVTDGDSEVAWANLTLQVNVDPLITSYSASPGVTDVGVATTFIASISGGTAPYTFSYLSLPPGCSTANTSSLPCTPSASGSFTVTLKIVDNAGFTVWGNATLTVHPAVVSSSSAKPTQADIGIPFTFNGSASGGTPSYTFLWEFGDGSPPSTSRNTTHTFSTAGKFSVRLWTNDSVGGSNVSTVTVTVDPHPSVASFVASPGVIDWRQNSTFSAGMVGGLFPFTYAYLNLPPGCPGANASSLDCMPQATGTYTVELRVTDADGQVAWSNVTLVVNVDPKILSFTVVPTTTDVGLNIVLSTSVTGGTKPYNFTYRNLPGGCPTTNSTTLTCYPTSSGIFQVNVTVVDMRGWLLGDTVSLTVNPQVQSAGRPSSPGIDIGMTVTFNGSGSGGTGSLSFVWDFGDGTPVKAARNPTHTYAGTGSYTVLLWVNDSLGESSKNLSNVLVSPLPRVSSILLTPSPIDANDTLDVAVTTSGGTLPFSFVYSGLPQGCASQNLTVMRCTPSTAGNYTVMVEIRDLFGHTAFGNATLTVFPPLTVATLVSSSVVDEGITIDLTGVVSGGLAPYSYLWTFGDGGKASTPAANHAYSAPGTYVVTFLVLDGAGGNVSKQRTITVTPPPTIRAVESISRAAVGETVSFTGDLTGGSAPVAVLWNFGDGVTNTTLTPSHAYAKPGSYTIVVTAKDSSGSNASATLTLMVYAALVLSSYGASPGTGEGPLLVHFSANVTGGASPVTLVWTFGDGQAGSGAIVSHLYNTLGSFTATLWVNDSAGNSVKKTIPVTVEAPLSVSMAFSSNGVVRGTSVVVTAWAPHGTPPMHYAWLLNGTPYPAAENYPSFTFVPAGSGSYDFEVVVTDNASARGQASETLLVLAPTTMISSKTTGNSNGPLGLLLSPYATVGVALAMAALVFLAYRLFRRKGAAGDGPSHESRGTSSPDASGPGEGGRP